MSRDDLNLYLAETLSEVRLALAGLQRARRSTTRQATEKSMRVFYGHVDGARAALRRAQEELQ